MILNSKRVDGVIFDLQGTLLEGPFESLDRRFVIPRTGLARALYWLTTNKSSPRSRITHSGLIPFYCACGPVAASRPPRRDLRRHSRPIEGQASNDTAGCRELAQR